MKRRDFFKSLGLVPLAIALERSPLPLSEKQVARNSESTEIYTRDDVQPLGEYSHRVTLDLASTSSGTMFPVGTAYYPVNNFADAMAIMGHRKIPLLHDVTNYEDN